ISLRTENQARYLRVVSRSADSIDGGRNLAKCRLTETAYSCSRGRWPRLPYNQAAMELFVPTLPVQQVDRKGGSAAPSGDAEKRAIPPPSFVNGQDVRRPHSQDGCATVTNAIPKSGKKIPKPKSCLHSRA